MWGRLRRFISGPVSRVFTETVCSVILIFILLTFTFYAVSGPSVGVPPYDRRAEALFWNLDYAEYLYSRHLKRISTVPEGDESLTSFIHAFRTEAERKADPNAERSLRECFSDEKISSDYLLRSIMPNGWRRGLDFDELKGIHCFFGKSAVSPDYAYIGLQIPRIESARIRVYASILASMRPKHYFFADTPGAYYNDEERIMVYIKIPSSDMKTRNKI